MDDSGQLQNIVSSGEITILNYSDGEIVDYPFVLLECEIAVKEARPSTSDNVDDISTGFAVKDGILEEQDHVLVETKSDCTRWPTIHGGFKALVQLYTGENLIHIKACTSGSWTEQDFKLTYIPSTLKRFVRVVYIKCSDSDGSVDAPVGVANDINAATKRLAFNARLLQTFTAQDLHQHGFGHRTFKLEEDSEGNPKINVFTSSLTTAEALKMTGGQLYDRFFSELSKSELHDPLCKFWAFMSCTHYDPPTEDFNERDIHQYVKAHTALGGGQLALFGTGGLHTWASSINELIPCFTNTKMIDRTCLFDDSSRRGFYWANYATSLGASMHELGHCFDLAHTPGGIMGRGFDDFNCVFSLWKNPPPLYSTRECTPIIGTVSEDAINKNKVSELCIADAVQTSTANNIQDNLHDNKAAVTAAKGLMAPPHPQNTSTEPQQVQEVLNIPAASRDKQDVDWMKNSRNLARPGDWSHGAKWYRSSAVILRYHSWFSHAEEPDITMNQPIVHWNKRTYGPVGSMADTYECSKTFFNTKAWLEEHKATLRGYVIHAGTYVNSIQTIGRVVTVQDGVENVEIFSEPYGTVTGRKYVFTLDTPDEHVIAMDVRAGAWIDAIRIHTNYKSSVMMGGGGGCYNHFQPPGEQRIVGILGFAGNYVGSLAVLLQSCEDSMADPLSDEDLIISAPSGIRLVELHNEKHGEVCRHWEFLDPSPPTRFTLNREEMVSQKVRILVQDDMGNIRSSGPFCDLEKMFAPPSEATKEDTHPQQEPGGDCGENQAEREKEKENEVENGNVDNQEKCISEVSNVLANTEEEIELREAIESSESSTGDENDEEVYKERKHQSNAKQKEQEITNKDENLQRDDEVRISGKTMEAANESAQQDKDSGDSRSSRESLLLRYY